MEAALPVVSFSGILENQMEIENSLDDLFSKLNHSLHRLLEKRTFVCFAMGELVPSTRILRLSNGGCPYPYHFRAMDDEVVELQVDAYPLGVRAATAYRSIECRLEPGDYVVFCSDGIIEARNAADGMFGFERTAEAIRQGCKLNLSAKQLINYLLDETRAFAGDAPQYDDQTIVVLSVDKPPHHLEQSDQEDS